MGRPTERSTPRTYQDPTVPLIALPTDFSSRRLNASVTIPEGGVADVCTLTGPGCIRHLWCYDDAAMTLEILVDGAEEPQVHAPLRPLFGLMQDREPYTVDCCAFTVLPNPAAARKDPKIPGTPGCNLYLPIPFAAACHIRIHGPAGARLVAMIDWHQYDSDAALTPYRFHVTHHRTETSPARGGYIEMANVSGRGFIAGLVTGYKQKNHSDMVFHTGGTTLLLDGETNPHALRGCNVEDDYGFTWGFNDHPSHWIGCPQHDNRGRTDQDGVFYRFFGPDPIAFRSSAAFRAGCRGDAMESVVYYYKESGSRAPAVETPSPWQVVGLFPGADDFDTFRRAEFVEHLDAGNWGPALMCGDVRHPVATLNDDHGWIDLRNIYFDRDHTATPLTAVNHSAYARARIDSPHVRMVSLRIAFADWCRVWLNGEPIATLRHDHGLATARLPATLREGANELLVKTNHLDQAPGKQLWAINCVIEQMEEPAARLRREHTRGITVELQIGLRERATRTVNE